MTNGYVENVAKKKTKRLEEVFYNIWRCKLYFRIVTNMQTFVQWKK
jgi:hypothetical protein